MRPRTRMLVRNLWATRGRVAAMVVAIAVALTGVGALLITRAVVLRESLAAYASTNPASAVLDVADGVDATLLHQVRSRPGVLDATARQTLMTRVRVDGEWRRMLLFVISPDDPLRLAAFRLESGTWPPREDALFIERAAGTVLGAGVGDHVEIAGPTGATTQFAVTGIAYDPALAPATAENAGYGYLTPAGLARLGFTPAAEQLKVTFGSGGVVTRNQAEVDAAASDLAAWLTAQGRQVHQIEAPPYQHPHQKQNNTILGMLMAFAVAALVLAGVLVAATLGGMLAAQTRQIGVMKTVGATTGQLLRMYLGATAVIAGIATVLAVGPALLAGYGLVDIVADLLNIDIANRALPWWVFTTFIAAGIGIPLLVALRPLVRAARITVRAALDDHGVDAQLGARRSDRLLARLRGSRTLLFAVRNLLRRRARLVLTVALLAVGGALFTSGLNIATAWGTWIDDGLARRAYDAELKLTEAAPMAVVNSAVRGVPAVTAAETITSIPATPADGNDRVEVQRTFPDGGHGGFTLTGLPADTTMVDFEVLDGRWLQPGDSQAVVLNQDAATRLGDPRVGSDIHLAAQGQISRWRVVGVVAEPGSSATVYTVPAALTRYTGEEKATTVRVRVDGDPNAAITDIEAALVRVGAPVNEAMPTSEFRSILEGHVAIFITTLITLAVLMAIVGALGLGSTMSITVTERTREFGIMQAIGATPSAVRRLVLTEGVLTGAIGSLLAIVLGVPLSALVGHELGRLSFGLPVPLDVSPGGLAAWLVLAIVGAAGTTLMAAQRAARLTIRETLTHQ